MKLTKSHVSNILNDFPLMSLSVVKWQNIDWALRPCPDSASMGSDCHCCGGCAANGHLLLLYNQKMLLQEEEKQEGEKGQGRLQHEKHAGRRGISPHSCMLKNTQTEQLAWSTVIHYSNFLLHTLQSFSFLPNANHIWSFTSRFFSPSYRGHKESSVPLCLLMLW